MYSQFDHTWLIVINQLSAHECLKYICMQSAASSPSTTLHECLTELLCQLITHQVDDCLFLRAEKCQFMSFIYRTIRSVDLHQLFVGNDCGYIPLCEVDKWNYDPGVYLGLKTWGENRRKIYTLMHQQSGPRGWMHKEHLLKVFLFAGGGKKNYLGENTPYWAICRYTSWKTTYALNC